MFGVSPVAGLRSEMERDEICLGAAGNAALITPEFAEWVTEVAPAIVKKFSITPVNV